MVQDPVAAKPGIRRMVSLTWFAAISRVHSNCRGVLAWRGHHRKSLWSKRMLRAFQQLWQAWELMPREGVANSLIGWEKPLIITPGVPTPQASQDKPLDRP